MVDERFDVVHGARLWWWRGKRMVRIAWSAGHSVDALLDSPEALAHLLDVYGRTIVTVARAANRYIEFELVIAGIGLFFTKIRIETARAQVWTCHSPLNCFFDGAASNALRARFEHAVLAETGPSFFMPAPAAVWQPPENSDPAPPARAVPPPRSRPTDVHHRS